MVTVEQFYCTLIPLSSNYPMARAFALVTIKLSNFKNFNNDTFST